MKHVLRVFAESKLRALEAYCVWCFFFSFSFFPFTFQLQDPQGRDCVIQVSGVRLGVS